LNVEIVDEKISLVQDPIIWPNNIAKIQTDPRSQELDLKKARRHKNVSITYYTENLAGVNVMIVNFADFETNFDEKVGDFDPR
jgi:hypothetical protein